MRNKIAVIDLGTNTFQLGIAELRNGKFNYLYEKSLAPKIGKGGISKGIISDEAIERAVLVLSDFLLIAKNYEIESENIYAFGTSAIRNAKNGEEFCELIKQKRNLTITIIDGIKEAELIAEGVKYAVKFNENPYLIMDIGGGSVEFIIANNQTLLWKQSFEIGGQRLMDLFFQQDPILPSEVKKLQNYCQEKLISLANAIHQYSPQTLVGSAGSFETLVDIYNTSVQPNIITQSISSSLPIESFYNSFYQFLEKDRDERLKIPGMIELRADMIVVASVLIDYVLKTFNIKELFVSNFALKEGVLSKLANNEPL